MVTIFLPMDLAVPHLHRTCPHGWWIWHFCHVWIPTKRFQFGL